MSRSFDCAVCAAPAYEAYQVTDAVWSSASFDKRQVAHLSCLAERLGRRLTISDFPDIPMNALLFSPSVDRA